VESIEHIKRRIKKLFALSISPNPNEAAAALEKAQELMREYSVHISAAELANMQRVEVKAGSRGRKIPRYESVLMVIIARAFGCRSAYGTTDGEWWYKVHDFIGPEHRVQIASYIAEVLLRKLRRARTAYVKSLYRVRKRYTKICRADVFCSGWVSAIHEKLIAIQVSPKEEKALDEYERSLGWTNNNVSIRRAGKGRNDLSNGYKSGSAVEIQPGVGVSDRRLSIGASS
jgi:hypothetical protein